MRKVNMNARLVRQKSIFGNYDLLVRPEERGVYDTRKEKCIGITTPARDMRNIRWVKKGKHYQVSMTYCGCQYYAESLKE